MKKKILLFSAMAMLTCGTAPAYEYDHIEMCVNLNGGLSEGVPIYTGDIITFSNTEMKVMTEEEVKATLPLSQIESISFSGLMSVDKLQADNAIRPLRNPVGDVLEIVCPPEQQGMLCVSDLSGALMLRVNDWKGEPVDVSTLSPGIYLVTIDNSTFKIIKK